jgi:hypothetical protein
LSQKVVELAEQFADGLTTDTALRGAWRAAYDDIVRRMPPGGPEPWAAMTATRAAFDRQLELSWYQQAGATAAAARLALAQAAGKNPEDSSRKREGYHRVIEPGSRRALWRPSEVVKEASMQAAMVREIFGPSPLRRQPRIRPSCRGRGGSIIARLAQATYGEREFPSGQLKRDRLGVLADALEEAGSGDVEMLDHLRSDGSHVRGCWCLDLVLARE